MKVSKSVCLVVLNNFKNDSRVLKEAITLKNNGYKVLVLAMFDEGQLKKEFVKEIQVQRLELKSRSWSKMKFVQILKYFEFLARAYSVAKHYNIIHCNDLNALPIGALCKILKNKKVVYDAHEFEINHKPNESKISIKINYVIEKTLIRYADKVITVSDSIANEYVKLYNIEKPRLVFNTPKYQEVDESNLFSRIFDLDSSQTIFLYQGKLSEGRGVELLVETFQSLYSEIKNNKSYPVIIFMGYGPLEGYVKDVSTKFSNIYFQPAVSPENIVNYASSADFGISLIEDVCLSYRYCLPNKLFEYIMSEIPVIVSGLYEMKNFIIQNKVGFVVKQNNIEELKKVINDVLQIDISNYKLNTKKTKLQYNWEEQEEVLINLYKELV
jgi:glycosyltransferase involved in cell wall biosynthesis